MLRLVLFCLPAALVSVAAGQAVIPPGYEGIVDITADALSQSSWPSLNNRGQIVWSKRITPWDDTTAEIFLYDNGTVTQLTNDTVRDAYPDINDAGVIVWSRGIGTGDTLEVVRYEDGELTRLTKDAYSDRRPRINRNGWITWNKWTGGGCEDSDSDIYLYDGTDVYRITYGGYSQQAQELNDLGDIVWTRYNHCHAPWTATIMMRNAEGAIFALTGDTSPIQCPTINNSRVIAWRGLVDLSTPGDRVFLYEDGITSILTEWGSNPYLNNRGDISFNRWHEDTQTWQIWLYRAGEFYQVTDGPAWNFDGRIDDYGNIVFTSGNLAVTTPDIRLLKKLPPGDMNCDGMINTFDIDPFVMALIEATQYQAQYADCDAALADLNLDYTVNVFDIDPFVEVLTR